MKLTKFILLILITINSVSFVCHAQSGSTGNVLKIDFSNPKKVTPIKYGWHYEEIGMIGEGGLYAEMVRNRAFEEANPPKGLEVKNGYYANVPNPTENPRKKAYSIDPLIGWKKYPETNSNIDLQITDSNPLNKFNPHSLQIALNENTPGPSGVVNSGFFGMSFKQGNLYKLSFYSRGADFSGSINVFLCDSTGKKISNVLAIASLSADWNNYMVVFEAEETTDKGMLFFQPKGTGKVVLDVVSLFPGDTWDDGKSVFRADIMRNLIDYAPDFLRFPGGCIVHGVNIETMYHWKETIGGIDKRPGAWSKWSPNYRTDGLGYHEFYELCEYLQCDAMYVTPSGLVCSPWVFEADEKDEYHHPDVDVQEYIQDAMDAIEYAIGPVDSEWGRKRAENGHPKPFPLKYLSIGNEDFGPTYYRHYDAFYRAIKSKYPQLNIIANSIIGNTPDRTEKRKRLADFMDIKTIDIFDEHYYKDVPWVIENYYKFDQYERPGPDLFIGELGIRGEHPLDVLGEAVFMLAMERNADLNPMIADRPLMRNWDFVEGRGNPLFFHTNSTSFKTFNYYMSKLFRDNKIDICFESKSLLGIEDRELGTDYLFSSAGYDSETNEVIIKVVNLQEKSISTKLMFGQGNKSVNATISTLSSNGRIKNTPQHPYAEYSLTKNISLNLQGDYVFEPKSITVFRFKKLLDF